MKIRYLGTAAAEGWPALFCRCQACREALRRGGKNIRTRAQALVDDSLLLDFGPDTYAHMLRWGIDVPNLKHCLITHTHEDHFYLDDLKLRCPYFANDTDEIPFTVYGNARMTERIEALRQQPDGEAYVKGLAWQTLPVGKPAEIGGFTVIPTPAHHNPREDCYNYIIRRNGKTLFYGHDTGLPDEPAWKLLEAEHFDFVSLDCTMLVWPRYSGHMNIDAVCQVRDRMLRTGCATEQTLFCINHFSHNGAFNADRNGPFLHEELEPLMAEKGFLVSYDGMTVEF